jgi:electron transfer flavoprotein alpha subunit
MVEVMDEIVVLVEHRQGEIRDITFEMLGKGRELAAGRGAKLTALLLGDNVAGLTGPLAARADVVEVIEDPSLAIFNSDSYQQFLAPLIRERKPAVVLIGHTSYGLDLAPGLATEVALPLITDVTDLSLEDHSVVAVRPVYGGKAKARVRARGDGAIVTVQPGAFASASERTTPGEVIRGQVAQRAGSERKSFVGFVEAPATDVDITQSDVVVSVGRGIGDPENIPMVEELARAMGAVLACSRPVVDKKWLPKARQVGISGKSVAPKLYLAVGISGAFQHLVGIKRAGMVIAINKDPNAPIFRVADYGVVADLFAVVPSLTARISSIKKAA